MNGLRQPGTVPVPWKKKFRRELRIGTGILLILVGLVGIVVPVLPGWTPLALGIILLAPKTRFSRWVRGLLKKMRKRMREQKQKQPPPGPQNTTTSGVASLQGANISPKSGDK